MDRQVILNWFDNKLFSNRLPILFVIFALTVFMGYHGLKLRMDAGFEKLLPLDHATLQ